MRNRAPCKENSLQKLCRIFVSKTVDKLINGATHDLRFLRARGSPLSSLAVFSRNSWSWRVRRGTRPLRSAPSAEAWRIIGRLWPGSPAKSHAGRRHASSEEALDPLHPSIEFDQRRPVTIALRRLRRLLARESSQFQFKRGDGRDFSHAVLAASYPRRAGLDNKWKRRIEPLPNPDRLAKIYRPRDLNQLVSGLESSMRAV
jgi:hypothetical protein